MTDYGALWDAQSATREDAMWAAWANPGDGIEHMLARIGPAVDIDGPVGSIGCGPGRLLVPVAARRGDVYGVDISGRMLGHCGHRLAAAGGRAKLGLVDGDGSLPWFDGWMAGIWSVLAFQHMPSDTQRRYVYEAARCLRPGGMLVVQWTHRSPESVLSFSTPVDVMTGWCEDAGFVTVDVAADDLYPTWRWATATRGA